YWARTRVLEYLNYAADRLPASVSPKLGPDATGVGWIYEYALVDKTGNHDLSQLRSIQDWYLRYPLQTVEGVAEVASIGGYVKQYQVELNPDALLAYNIPLAKIKHAIQRSNNDVGGRLVEMGETEYMVRGLGYIKSIADLETIPVGVDDNGTPIFLKQLANIHLGPELRRGLAELNGEGEVAGGIIIMRFGENALATIERVREKLEDLKAGLPEGVEIVPVYDRGDLIERAVDNLKEKLIEESIVVAIICLIFLMHVRSALVAIISLPIGILMAFLIMSWQGLSANIMSLGGIAIAIGAMIDGAIVMIENAHKHLEQAVEHKKQAVIPAKAGIQSDHDVSQDVDSHLRGNDEEDELNANERWTAVLAASKEVGPALFFSLLIITVSFLPVFTLQAQEGRLFAPLAFTKTYAMAASAFLAITLVPVLMGYFIRGKVLPEHKNPINRILTAIYLPVLNKVLRFPKFTLLIALMMLGVGMYPVNKIGGEFIPPLDEGDLMYMPTTYPGISIGKARELLQQTDKLIKTVPEVVTVFGKVGRAETATDPAPITMIETFIQLKPTDQWRPGLTKDDLKKELDALVKLPGVTNAWVEPIKTRIDMLATGIKTPVGIKIAGPKLIEIQKIGKRIEEILKDVPGTASVYSERVAGGRYIKVDIQREKAARYGLNIADIQMVVASAIGGMNVTQTVEGFERYPVNLRYPQDYRDSPEKLALLPIITPMGQRIPLGDVANVYVEDGPPGIKSENARLNGWSFVDIEGIDVGTYVVEAQKIVQDQLELPPGYSISWSGQYEYMVRAKEK
ncbi:MAG: efflux RND transporter permease subunit, partial [Ghiorsea sp.]|nr:efflux RND transporter permease subunit [Ghiorsea sp.]